ncbi:MAG: hypothetical protein WAW96_03840 [Alphaproteobacteria bacterium]
MADVKLWMRVLRKDLARASLRQTSIPRIGPSGEVLPSLGEAQTFLAMQRARSILQSRLVKAGKLHSVEDCKHRRISLVHLAKARLLELPRSMANTLVGQTTETIERLMTEQIHAILEEFAGDDSSKPKTEPQDA